MNNVYSQTYEIERFDRAKETIRSPITIENEAETERKMRETVLSVGDRYSIVEEITTEQINYMDEVFDAVDTFTNQTVSPQLDEDEEAEEQLSYDEIVLQLQEILSSEITDNIDDLVFMHLIQLEEDERNKGREAFVKAVKKVLENGVRIENIQSAKEE